MAAKKTAKKSAPAKAAKKAPPKKAVARVKPAPEVAAEPPEKPAAKPAERPPLDAVARAAYLNYRRRVEQGLPGDSHGDWLQAERQLSQGSGGES
jgi:hypothetical protein